MSRLAVSCIAVGLILSLVSQSLAENTAMTTTDWGTIDGMPVKLYTLTNENGLVMKVTNYGAIITSLTTPDRDGKMADIVLGYDSLDSYIAATPYFGCITGRCANHLAKGRFTLDGKSYQLALNNGPHHLHGGRKGFDKTVWNATVQETSDGPSIRLTRVSPDGEENYPGELTAKIVYALTNKNELKIEITATTDAPTICNLVQHTYWNLAGHDSGTVYDHIVQFNADRYLPVSDEPIPTGELAPVEGTPFDFRKPKPIGQDLKKVGGDPIGYDHNLILNGEPNAMKLVCKVTEPTTGRVLELHANQPGCQFYGGNFLDGSNVGKGNAIYQQHHGFCLETQHYPDSIHHEGDWPSVILRPGQKYRHTMIVLFSAE